MGPDFLDRQSLWYMFCCYFIFFCFNLEQFNEPGIRQTKPDIRPDKKVRIPGATLFVTLHHDAI